MPCRDYESDWGRNCDEEKKRLDQFAAMLCASCKLMTDEQIASVKGLQTWWEQHQIDDAVALAERVREKRRRQRRRELCASLSDEDKRLLGVTDCDED